MNKSWQGITASIKNKQGIDADLLWKDFSVDLAARHLSAFHLTYDKRIKYLQSFQTKVFRLTEVLSPEEHYRMISESPKYRQYFTECFDPTWKGQQVFKWVRVGAKKDPDRLKQIEEFLDTDIQFSLFIGLYLHHVILPHDDGWMREIEAERKALSDIRSKVRWGTLFAPEVKALVNPLRQVQTKDSTDNEEFISDENSEKTGTDGIKAEVSPLPQSGLDKKQFNDLIRSGKISDYVAAANLLLRCDLPEDIAQIYQQLVERMPVLQDAVVRFADIYQADMDQFEEYFAPEALKITAVYLDYQTVGPSEKILKETRDGVFLATRKLLQVVNEKIDEIYRFVMIDANAQAKAIETLMSQDGYVDPEFRIK